LHLPVFTLRLVTQAHTAFGNNQVKPMKTKTVKSMGALLKRGTRYYAKWRCDGKQFCKALRNDLGAPITTLPEAEVAKAKLMEIFAKKDKVKVLRELQNEIDETLAGINNLTPAMPIAQVWAAFASPTSGRKPCEKSTLQVYESLWTQFQTWLEERHPEVKALNRVDWEVAKEYLDAVVERGVSNGTYNQHLSFLRYAFKTLAEQAKLNENVWLKFRPLQVVRESRRELTIDELTLVCSKAQGEMKVLFCLGLYTGLRLGDCATLKWGEVDLKRGLIRRIPNKIRRKRGMKGLVEIAIHPVLRDVLTAIPGSKTDGFVLPSTADMYLFGNRCTLTLRIQKHFQACGIETKRERENGLRRAVEVGFHSLRHTFISMCAMNNVPLAVVQGLVGHSSPLMTEHYSHSNRIAEQQAVAALPIIPTIPT
jgi:integrase